MVPVRIASSSRGSRPHLRARASTSPRISSVAALIALPASLTKFAVAGALPTTNVCWPNASKIGRQRSTSAGASGDDEQLAGLGGIRISEDRRCDVALCISRVLARELGCRRGADGAHRQMNGARDQAPASPPTVRSGPPNTSSRTAASSGAC